MSSQRRRKSLECGGDSWWQEVVQELVSMAITVLLCLFYLWREGVDFGGLGVGNSKHSKLNSNKENHARQRAPPSYILFFAYICVAAGFPLFFLFFTPSLDHDRFFFMKLLNVSFLEQFTQSNDVFKL